MLAEFEKEKNAEFEKEKLKLMTQFDELNRKYKKVKAAYNINEVLCKK